jgi:hypothetical protein
LIVLQEKLKKEFDSVKTKMKEAIEDGDDFWLIYLNVWKTVI